MEALIKKAGNVNAAYLAIIFDINGKEIGYCMDTPNNAAYACLINKDAETVKTPFNGAWTRSELQKRFSGLDAKYHSQHVKFF